MRIINDKYKIEKLIINSRSYSMYEGINLLKGKKRINIYILNDTHIEKTLLETWVNEFEKIGTLMDSYINVLDFGSTINLSSKEKKLEYFYVTESLGEYKPLGDICDEVEENALIDIFVDICKIAQEQCFSYIKTMPFSIENIYVSKENKVKLKDKITSLLDSREIGMPIHYEAKENYKDAISTEITNETYYIERLKEIFVNMVLQNKGIKLHGKIQSNIEKTLTNNDSDQNKVLLGEKMSTLLNLLYKNNSINKEKRILNIIKIINKVLKTSYTYVSNKKEKLDLNIPLIGRSEDVGNIIKSINKSTKENENENIILIHGEIGIGKTRLVKHIKHLVDTNYKNILKSFYVTDSKNGIAISNLLRQVVIDVDKAVLNKYKKELSVIIPEIYGEENIDFYSNGKLKINNDVALMAKIALFLLEYCNDKKAMIILDNVHMYDSFTLGIIQYILNRTRVNKNIPLIISYRDGDCLGNSDFIGMISKINTKVDLEVHLTPLSEEMMSIMLKNILNVDKISQSFSDLIYNHSMGNPLFIEEGIKYLKDKKVVYIDETDGMWKKILNHEIYMSTDMEEVCKNQLQGLNEECIKILYAMSYFYMPLSLPVIVEILDIDEEKLKSNLTYLVYRGILYKTRNNNLDRYTFYNKFLKNYLCRNITKEDSIKKHNEIVKIIMPYYERNKEEYSDEIIYHLEKIKDKRILKFYTTREKELEKLNKIQEAIKFNLKILTFIDENKESENLRKEEIAANMSLGDLYNKLSEKRISMEYYLTAKNLCNEKKYLNEYIDILKEVLFLSIDLGLEKNINRYLKEMRAAVEKTDYRIGKLKYLCIIIWQKYNKQEYEKVKELCNYGISLCEEADEEYRLTLMNYYIDTLVVQGNVIEGLELLKPMYEQCKELNLNKRTCRVINSLGVIYSDYLQCEEEGLKWFEKYNDFGFELEDDSYRVNCLSNLGFMHYIMLNYDKAYEYFNLASNKAIETEILGYNFYNFSYIGTILYKQGKFSESYKYAKLCSHYINKDYTKFWQEAGPYCIFMNYISDITGNEEEAKKYLEQGLETLKDSNSVVGYELALLYNIYCICYQINNTNVLNVIKAAEKILYVDFRISMLSYCINKLIYLDLEEAAVEIYKYILNNKDKCKSEINKAELDYLGVVLKQDVNYKKLIKSLELIKNKNLMLYWRVNFELAKGFYNEKKYTDAAGYIYECCGTIIDIIEELPSECVEQFINKNPHTTKAFELILKIQYHYGVIKANEVIGIDISKVKNAVSYLKGLLKQNIVNNNFLQELKRHNKAYCDGLKTIDEIIGALNGDINENLNSVAKDINILAISTRTMILFENEGELQIAASSDETRTMPEDLSLINLVRTKNTPIISKDMKILGINGQIISYDVKNSSNTTMCIPINQSLKSGRISNNKECNNDLIGFIYVESNKRINNINVSTMKKCGSISRILYMLIDRDNIRRSSSIDNLTSALIRKHLEMFIQDQIEKSYTCGSEFSIVMLDIDKFKEINDNYGHGMGDKVLSELCKTILTYIRKSDVIGRYGGEEFIIVLPDTDTEKAKGIAERIGERIQHTKLLGDKREVTVSMGIANYPKHATTYYELIEKADQALYEAKDSGRNRTKIWNESYGYKISTTNRLSGIFVGNGDQDYKNVSTVIEFIDLINDNLPINEKIINTINRISEITEADLCALYIVNNNELVKKYHKSIESYEEANSQYSISIINSAIKFNENTCGIDWSCIKQSNELMSIPDIKSNMVILLRNKTTIIGAIHVSASINHKEFNYDQLNYINTLAKIMVPMLEDI